MKDKDKAFFEALDTLKAKGINPVAAAHWRNAPLREVLNERKLSGWRAWFFERWPKDLELESNENGAKSRCLT